MSNYRETSQEAWAEVKHTIPETSVAVLEMLRSSGPMTEWELTEELGNGFLRSSTCGKLLYLRQRGLVIRTDRVRRNPTGRKAALYRALRRGETPEKFDRTDYQRGYDDGYRDGRVSR